MRKTHSNGLENVEFMLKYRVGMYWRFISLIVFIAILIYFIANIQRLQHDGYDFSDVSELGWAVLGFAFVQVVMWWIYYLWHKRRMSLHWVMKPSFSQAKWGPKNTQKHKKWQNYKKELRQRRREVKTSALKRLFFLVSAKQNN